MSLVSVTNSFANYIVKDGYRKKDTMLIHNITLMHLRDFTLF